MLFELVSGMPLDGFGESWGTHLEDIGEGVSGNGWEVFRLYLGGLGDY